MWESGSPLADLVLEAAKTTTYRELAKRAIDRITGYEIDHQMLWKIAQGKPVKINPALVRAVAAAVGKPDREVQIAAAHQYIGLIADDPLNASTEEAQVIIAHVPGLTAADMPRAQEVLRQWAERDKRRQGEATERRE